MESQSSIDWDNLDPDSYIIISPSYKRSNIACSHLLFDKERFYYAIREEELPLYEGLGVKLKVIPKDMVRCISTTRNWIFENNPGKLIITVDDDMKKIMWILNRKMVPLSNDDIHQMILNGFEMAIDCKSGMWGINCQSDPMFYQPARPLSFSNIILGPFSGWIDTSLRYDEALNLKEDYDMFLQQLNKHRIVMRLNMFCYQVNHFTLPGGCQTYRNDDREMEQCLMLQKKWGSQIVGFNLKSKGSVNMRIRKPI